MDIATSIESQSIRRVGNIVLDVEAHCACISDQCTALTRREQSLLMLLIEHPGKVFSRSELLDAVWGLSYEGHRHTVNSHINQLRAKLEPDPGQPVYIRTVWGTGYKLDA